MGRKAYSCCFNTTLIAVKPIKRNNVKLTVINTMNKKAQCAKSDGFENVLAASAKVPMKYAIYVFTSWTATWNATPKSNHGQKGLVEYHKNGSGFAGISIFEGICVVTTQYTVYYRLR